MTGAPNRPNWGFNNQMPLKTKKPLITKILRANRLKGTAPGREVNGVKIKICKRRYQFSFNQLRREINLQWCHIKRESSAKFIIRHLTLGFHPMPRGRGQNGRPQLWLKKSKSKKWWFRTFIKARQLTVKNTPQRSFQTHKIPETHQPCSSVTIFSTNKI